MNDKAQRCALVFAAAVATAPAWAVQDLNVGMAGTPNAKPGFVPGDGDREASRRDDAVVAGRSRQPGSAHRGARQVRARVQRLHPAFVNPLLPTAAELRQRVIYVNYRALLDPTAAAASARSTGRTSTRTARHGGRRH